MQWRRAIRSLVSTPSRQRRASRGDESGGGLYKTSCFPLLRSLCSHLAPALTFSRPLISVSYAPPRSFSTTFTAPPVAVLRLSSVRTTIICQKSESRPLPWGHLCLVHWRVFHSPQRLHTTSSEMKAAFTISDHLAVLSCE